MKRELFRRNGLCLSGVWKMLRLQCRVCESSMSRLIPNTAENAKMPLQRRPHLEPRLKGKNSVFSLQLILIKVEGERVKHAQ